MSDTKQSIPNRSDIKKTDKWDLSTLYANDDEWQKDLDKIANLASKVTSFKGVLSKDKQTLASALNALEALSKTCEKVGNYAFLLQSGDQSDDNAQDKYGRYIMQATNADAETSFFTPELQSIDSNTLTDWLKDDAFAPYRVFVTKLLRLKPYILSEKEERLLAMQAEANETAHKTFSMLTNVDLSYGDVNGKPITQSTFATFLENKDRAVRKSAYTQFYNAFDAHKNTIASLYAGSVTVDVTMAKARGYANSLEAALFSDKVASSVYHNLIDTVHANLAPLHKYYSLRRKALGLQQTGEPLRHYDVYVPLIADVKKITPYTDAVNVLSKALSPLGDEYVETLCNGLLNGWVDRYENKGKRSGAFSSGGYEGYPYILMNYKDDSIRDVFTLAHEGGHSMHSYYSAKANPFMQYNYTIFEAEVASTFNEELLFRYYLKTEKDPAVKNWLIVHRAADILATLYRQTMFAEYELKTHELVESGTPLSLSVLRAEYKKLLELYFGKEVQFEETSDLEGLRIPHFYNAFYVYKYATGISAALALAERVAEGGAKEREDYFAFLKSGGSRYPIEALKVAGVDMQSTAPISAALKRFAILVDNIEEILQ